jgi:ATP-dependent helicase/nuclease subunit A
MAETKWTNEQWEAITAENCSLLVAAAAGAGKTAVLVERIIRKITDKDNPIDIDRLLVVTFTKAAATEMRERIAEAISAVLENNPENINIQRQLILLNKANITTIHSFCLEVIRSNFQKIDIDPAFRIADDTEAMLLKIEVLDELFEGLYAEEAKNQDFFQLLECYGGNRDDQALQDMVLNLYTFIQSDPWPEKWLAEMIEELKNPESGDFGTTLWGKVLLDAVSLELEGLEENMKRAIEISEKAPGLDKYLSVFSEELALVREIQGLCLSENNPKWDDLYRAFQNIFFRRLPAAGKEADEAEREKVKDLRDGVKKSLNKIRERIFSGNSEEAFRDLQTLYPLMQCLARLVEEFGEKYALKKSEKAIVDFNDLEHFCLEILTERCKDGQVGASPIALGYKERFAEILVDEYQDSNLVQEIIIKMISKDESGRPNIFMVGDVKQSIYRFRQAKPELFLEKYHKYSLEQGASLRKILLYKNFRSRKEVVDAVNFLFQQVMSVKVGELDYTEEEALNPGAAFAENEQEAYVVGGEVEFHLLQTKRENMPHNNNASNKDLSRNINMEYVKQQEETGFQENEEGEDNLLLEPELLDNIQGEARLVACRIRELIKPDQQGKSLAVYDRGRQEYRALEYRDIVILLRTTKNWSEVFTEELAAEGIPAFADTGTGFLKTSEVQVILSLLQVIDNPLQDIPLLAVLRSPLVSLTTDELAGIRLTRRKGPLFEALQVFAEGQSGEEKDNEDTEIGTRQTRIKVVSFLVNLRKWREMSFYLSTDQLLGQIYNETGYYGIVGAMPAGEQRQANLRILFERARQYEETSFKGLFNFLNFIDKLKSNQGDLGSAKILGENDNVVRIMSIHKSKGLEFPVVILAGCGKKFNLQDHNKSILFHPKLGFGPDVVDTRLRFSYPSLPKQAIREQLKVETLSEEMRILYVALTRAREKLIIIGAVGDIPKEIEKWARIAQTDAERLPSYDILKGDRYLDWIGPALLRHQDGTELRGCLNNGEGFGPGGAILEDTSSWSVRFWKREDVLHFYADQGQGEDNFILWLDGLEGLDNNLKEKDAELFHRLNWEYPYVKFSKIPAKISVTELKRRFEKEISDGYLTSSPTPAMKMKKPLFLEKKKGLTAAEAGTVMHFVMQHLDFRQDAIEEQISEMVKRDLLTPEQAQSVDPKKIRYFLTSPLGKRMLKSEIINREVPFNIEIPCHEVYSELDAECYQGETVLLQGIIDCYFEETDGIVLVDYKTDRLAEGWEETIRNRYEVQISYYARALEMLTGKPVKEKYIYLFTNGEVVELKGICKKPNILAT